MDLTSSRLSPWSTNGARPLPAPLPAVQREGPRFREGCKDICILRKTVGYRRLTSLG